MFGACKSCGNWDSVVSDGKVAARVVVNHDGADWDFAVIRRHFNPKCVGVVFLCDGPQPVAAINGR